MSSESKIDTLQWEVTQRPSSAKTWVELLSAVKSQSSVDMAQLANETNAVFERSVRAIPYSFKLWMLYLTHRNENTKFLCTIHEWFQSTRELYERALEKLPRMPLLWVSYLQHLLNSPVEHVSMIRHVVGRSLTALPPTQHHMIWKVVRAWSTAFVPPIETLRALWGLYLLFDTSAGTHKLYLTLLLQRGDRDAFIHECIRATRMKGANCIALLEDIDFWEPIRLTLETVGWRYTGELSDLEALVTIGSKYCASPISLKACYAAFLYGQGHVKGGRQVIIALLEDAPNPVSFSSVYKLATELEDQILESFALDRTVLEMSEQSQNAVHDKLFGGCSPLYHLKRLLSEYPLLFNQSQLRTSPQHVPFWLKRVELLKEKIHSSGATREDLFSLYRQSIAQCTSGMEVVDPVVGQLYDSYAIDLWDADRGREAQEVLMEGAWAVPFSTPVVNACLFGLLCEMSLAMGDSLPPMVDTFVERLTARAHPSTRTRVGLMSPTATVPAVLQDSRPWTLLADLCVLYQERGTLSALVNRYSASLAHSAEGACYMTFALSRLGCDEEATRELEKAVATYRSESSVVLFLAEQHMSYLIERYGESLPLHQFREIVQLVEECAPQAVHTAPVSTMSILLSCAHVESKRGLYGNAVRLLQQAATIAVSGALSDDYTSLQECVIERTIHATHTYRGVVETRQLCTVLLRQVGEPSRLQCIALNWAAIEKRSGNIKQAHVVLGACCDSQDPRTMHGSTFWKLWQSMCQDVKEFENVERRKQQVVARFKRPAHNG